MKPLLRPHWLLALLLSLGSLPAARASHLLGGDITYSAITSTTAGVPRYHVVLRRFINVYADGGLTFILNASRGSCTAPATGSFSVQIPRTQLLSGNSLNCTSNNTPAYQLSIHEVDINLPAGVWILSYEEAARNNDIQNIPASGTQAFYLNTMLDSSLPSQDSSPRFESAGLSFIAPAALTSFSRSAFDVDGDSLRYELVLPASSCSQTLTATPPPHFSLNPATGHFTPTATTSSTQGIYNVTIRVSEYRKLPTNRWALIGYVTHESPYVLYSSANQPPAFTTMQVNGGPLLSTNPPIVTQPGQTVNVTLQAADPDAGQTIRFASEAPGVVPGLSLTRIGTTNSVQLTWQVPATLPPGRYAIAIGVLDNGCTVNASQERTLVFVVGGGSALATRTSALASAEVYPTPFREQVQFQTSPHQAVVLFDALGREVARLRAAPDGLVRWLPAPSLPAGLYLARDADTGQPLARLLRAE